MKIRVARLSSLVYVKPKCNVKRYTTKACHSNGGNGDTFFHYGNAKQYFGIFLVTTVKEKKL